MKPRAFALSALLLAATTASAFAMCNGKHRVISCAEGMVYDFEKRTCVAATSS